MPRVFDLASGRVLFSLNWGDIEVGAFSPDGRTIVTKQGYDLCVLRRRHRKRTPHDQRSAHEFVESWSVLAFTPDGKAIAVIIRREGTFT